MKDILRNKILIFIALVLIIFTTSIAYAINLLSSERKELKFLKERKKEMLILKHNFLALRHRIDAIERKKDLSHMEGIMQAIDNVFSSLGLKDKLKTIKSSGVREIKDGLEEESEIYIEKVTMNEMLNIFYTIEHIPVVLTVKKVTIKKTFEDPELLNISLTLSFLKLQ